jgi:opacity protein-like surface antigen
MNRTAIILAAALLAGSPFPAFAQDNITFRGFADAGLTVFTATQSFKAILGSASGPTFGGGIEVGLTRNVFVSVGASRFRRTGHRVFVFQNEVFKLDVPDTITVTPLELSGRYRFGGVRTGTFTPYVGGGIGWHRFAETSGHSTTADDVTATHTGYHVFAGVETPIGNWIAAAVDAQLSTVPDAFGGTASSVGNVYNENNLGGFTVRARIIVGR